MGAGPAQIGFGGAQPTMSQPSPISAPPVGSAGAGQGTGFIGWDRILNANKDAATAQANKTADKLAKPAQKAQTQLGTAQGQFRQDVHKGTPQGSLQPIPDVAPINPREGGIAPGGVATQGAITPPQTRAQQRAGLERDAAATYSGPGSLAEGPEWSSLLSGATEAQRGVTATQMRDANGNVRGTAGLEALLREGQGGGYTGGESSLDASLLGSAGRRRFNELQRDYGSLLSDYEKAQADSKTLADTARGDTEGLAAGAKAGLAKMDAEDEAYRNTMSGIGNSLADGTKGATTGVKLATWEEMDNPVWDATWEEVVGDDAEGKALYDSMTPEEYAEMLKIGKRYFPPLGQGNADPQGYGIALTSFLRELQKSRAGGE